MKMTCINNSSLITERNIPYTSYRIHKNKIILKKEPTEPILGQWLVSG